MDNFKNSLNLLKVGWLNNFRFVNLVFSKSLVQFLEILVIEGLIYGFQVVGKSIRVELNFLHFSQNIRKVVIPKCFRFFSKQELQFLNQFDLAILSTDSGFMTHKEAFLRGIGGILMCVFNF